MKAGKLLPGDFSVEKAVRSGTAKLVMLDESASKHKKQWRDACSFRNIPLIKNPVQWAARSEKPARMVCRRDGRGFFGNDN